MTARQRTLARGAAAALLLTAVLLGWWQWTHPAPSVRELTRSQLELRDSRLYATGEDRPFTGRLIETYSAQRRKLEIEINGGEANGRSRGWYENGQLEVEETFVKGVSSGPRKRWYANGSQKSLAQIESGKVVGRFIEWHENGRKAVEMTLVDGKPDGLVEAWHPSGSLKSQVQFDHGREVAKEFWPEQPVAAN